ncbi:ABC transporter ATP-binding protein (plasmid) [Brasilonema octagenarum UFV-E1]|uniref:ABC transporter ATP-binding protein n=2 Tax=Brasilonema TaxID=383614 RepID=A0A856MSN5_9CYAN|nr:MULTISPECIES: ATP-binding cassette domain-containing protein [Brasilonema]NMF62573.1 ABC transporter ATP-binding protein [Brasilonema octagenarum UFV-OR1]QDL12647.1 ABC transporter ATP-binding protein [Brasilonema sennae CENA114]QDL19041.1 ABC transporter ATP-binding protein [Brasilonema octagenarum UFV-E1]
MKEQVTINTPNLPSTPSFPTEAIHVRGLRKHYGRLAAVRLIDFTVHKGELFGLIGPDGAGKTTTFHILGGVMEATAGEVQIFGQLPRDARSMTGYLTQQFSLYLDLSIDENLRYAAGLRQVSEDLLMKRRNKYLRLMNLEQFGDRLAGQLSGGMKQKLALCCALVSQPQILLLDEPTIGVDPISRREFWDVLAALSAEGMTIVVATPYLDEAERCHRVALMYDGQIQEIGTPASLRASLGLHRLEVRTANLEMTEQVLSRSAQANIVDVQTFGDRLDVLVKNVAAGETQVRELLQQHQLPSPSIERTEPTLENVFVSRLRQQGSAPQFFQFPRYRGGRGGKRERGEGGEMLQQLPQSPTPPLPRSSSSIAIYAHNLSRSFGKFQAVKSVNVEVRYGEIFGLLGANGAGKTTTIKMLCGLLRASGGEISLGGETRNLRNADLRRRIGYMSQKFTLYDDLTILENLEFYSGVYGVPRKLRREKIDWVIATCGLLGQEHMLTGQLPGGWKQRVAFGASVMHEPDILFLDEPTSGVDPLARRQFWKLINDFARNGTAILVTTHYLEEAEQCNCMSFMVAGETVAEGSPSFIKASQPGQLIEMIVNQNQAASNLLKQYLEPWRVSIFANSLHVVLDNSNEQLPQILKLLESTNLIVHSLRPIPFSLEDAFIGIVQRT